MSSAIAHPLNSESQTAADVIEFAEWPDPDRADSSQDNTTAADSQIERRPAQQRLIAWLRAALAGSCGVSLLTHAMILFGLSLIEMTRPVTTPVDRIEVFSAALSDADDSPGEFVILTDLSESKSGGEASQAAGLLSNPFDDFSPTFAPEVAANAAKTAGTGTDEDSDGLGDADGFLFKMPTGGRAVRQGSFSAWTVPADPLPREEYVIVIRIKVPSGTKTFRLSDITGNVIGTDDFVLRIPFDPKHSGATTTERSGKIAAVKPTDFLKIVDEHVQIMVKIPGAAGLVRDTIEVRSKLLREEQRLQIVF